MMRTCQTMARNEGSDHVRRSPFLGAERVPAKRGSAVAPDMTADQRIGGAYCRPPLVQMLLMPRLTPIGVILRSHTSPRLPTCLMTLYAHLLSIPSALPISPSSPNSRRT